MLSVPRPFTLLLSILTCLTAFSVTASEYELTLRALYTVPPTQWPASETADHRQVRELAPLTLLGEMPADNAVTLGAQLFNDPILSRDKTVSCGTCHEARLQFTDGRRFAIGIDAQVGRRNTPAIFGIDHWQSFFWDGRAKTAEQQALMPIQDPKEMDMDLAEAIERLNAHPGYPEQFKAVFDDNIVTADMLAAALVAFERTLSPPESVFGHFIRAAYKDPITAVGMLNDAQLRGLHLFRTKAKCMTCHNGPLLSDNQFHVTGFHYYQRKFHDVGRYEVTQNPADSGAFRTPSLLGVNKTAPWLHNGLLKDMMGVVQQYNAGGARPKPRGEQVNDPLFPKTTALLLKLGLTKQEREDLVAFLETL